MNLHVGVTTGVPALWQEAVLVDFTIEVEDQELKVHKVIMASVSDYFRAMLTAGLVESQIERVRLKGLSLPAVSNVIDFIYTGQFGTKTTTTQDMLGCAVYFQFPAAIDRCTELLFGELNEENCFEILNLFEVYSMKSCVEQTQNYIKSKIDYILKIHSPNELPYDAFLLLMDCWGKSEWDLFDSANMWISVDFESRVQHLNDLMSHIRFALMSPAELVTIQNSYIFSAFKDTWCDLVCNAIEFHNLPIHHKVLDNSGQSMVREDLSPVCFASDSVGEYYVGRSWKKLETLQPPKINQPAAVLEVNNYLIACDEYQRGAPDQNWYIFDPRTGMWEAMAQMATARDAFALVYHGQYLYALGGLVRETPAGNVWSYSVDDSIERYDFQSNTWSKISSKLPGALQNHAACAIGSFIYVTGGCETQREKRWHSAQLHRFDPSADSWVNKAPMRSQPSSCKVLVMNLWDEEVMFVISDDFQMEYYTPSTNEWSVYEYTKYITTDLRWAAGGTLLGKGNTLIFLNFFQNIGVGCRHQCGPRWRNRRNYGYRRWNQRDYDEEEEEDEEDWDIASARWTLGNRGQEITEDMLDTCPVGKKSVCGLLSFMP